jgi:ketosteroid isomerase-like protein
MSQENVEIVKRGIDAFNRGDLDLMAGLVTPNAEVSPAITGSVDGRGLLGAEAYRSWFEEISDTWQEFRILADEFRDLGDCVVMLGRITGRGRGSGVAVDAPIGQVYDFRDHKISRLRAFLDHGEWLRATGLTE